MLHCVLANLLSRKWIKKKNFLQMKSGDLSIE